MDGRDPLGEPPIELRVPAAVRAVAEAVRGPGRTPVYAVGGAVRDRLLGLPVPDHDFATAVRPAELAARLAPFGPVSAVAWLGRVAVHAGATEVVFTTFRVESGYGPDRRPAVVRFVDRAEDDAARRDFTVNAIYVELGDGSVVDPHGGRADLRDRLLRVVGPPRARLAEDPLRILRAVRFEASRGLRPTAATAAAMAECAPLCAGLRPERRFDELHRALSEPRADLAVARLLDLGALGSVVPELAGAEARIRAEVLPLLAGRPAGGTAAIWAALLGEAGRAERALGELRAPRGLRREVRACLALATRLDGWDRAPAQARRRALAEAPAAARSFALELLAARGDRCAAEALAADLAAVGGTGLPPLPDGRAVLALGVPPGPLVGAVLAALRARVDAAGLRDPDAIRAALADEVRRLVKGGPGPDR